MNENKTFLAESSVTIDAPIEKVWRVLTTPEIIKRYFFGTDVVSDWQVGSSITWKGEWQGEPYEDKGEILVVEENRKLQFSHFSPVSGKPDVPENYHVVTFELESEGDKTKISLSQDNNENEEVRKHSEENWNTVLEGMKKLLET
jgi:uncharacterized protein YndB with AHSA1/START domain